MAGIEPATATLAGRARYLSCHPRAGFGIICLDLPFHGAHAMDVSIIQPVREAFRDESFPGRSIRPEVNETAPEGLPLGRLRATACSRLPGNHSAGQDSRKPRRRIHVSGPLRRLARGHVSMVSRWRKPGNCISGGIPRCGAGARATAPGYRRETGFCHSGTARTETYDVDAVFTLLERNAVCLIGPLPNRSAA